MHTATVVWLAGEQHGVVEGVDSSEATFLLVDQLSEGREVFGSGGDGGVMSVDVDDVEGFGDFTLVMREPSESRDEVFDFRAKVHGKGVAFLAIEDHAFIAADESDIELIEALVGDSAEADGADAGSFAEVLFEGEGALGTSEEAADLLDGDVA